MFYKNFVSPQVKQCAIITNEHGIYELPHELPNDLRLRILQNQERSGNFLKLIEPSPIAQSSFQNKFLLLLGKTLEKQKLNFSRSVLFNMKTRVSLKYFVNKSNSIQTSSNLTSVENCGNSKAFHTILT